MDAESIKSVALPAAGVSGGGVFVFWFAKMMMSRLISQYDKKHENHENKLAALSDKLSNQLQDLQIKLAKLEPAVTMAMSLRADVKASEAQIAVIKDRAEKARTDLNTAYSHIRSINEKLEELKTQGGN